LTGVYDIPQAVIRARGALTNTTRPHRSAAPVVPNPRNAIDGCSRLIGTIGLDRVEIAAATSCARRQRPYPRPSG